MNVTEKTLQYARDKPENLSAVNISVYDVRKSMNKEVRK